jgi:hypothetical protein
MSAKALLSASVSAPPAAYVEDVFSTYLYTGNGSTQTITNGIDLAGEGGLVWVKSRSDSGAGNNHTLRTEGLSGLQFTNSTSAAQGSASDLITSTSSGFSVNTGFAGGTWYYTNGPSTPYASWTFRKAEKFFDVVTYTGDDTNRTIAHNLGSVPGCIIVKKTSGSASWNVYHRSTGNTNVLFLNLTDAFAADSTRWNNTTPTATEFSLGTSDQVNQSGATYVAYLFAHDAGGFGDAGTDSVVKCGSYTGNSATEGPFIDLGWEPQFLLLKAAGSTSPWVVVDNMRGLGATGGPYVLADTVNTEAATVDFWRANATGFQIREAAGLNQSGVSYIYIAIRRGPMKTPTDATEVFNAVTQSTTGTFTAGFPVDLVFSLRRDAVTSTGGTGSRLTGNDKFLRLKYLATDAEATATNVWNFGSNTEFYQNLTAGSGVEHVFRRAPGFFDVVAYTGTNTSGQNAVSHNLGVTPELIIYKVRTGPATTGWYVYAQPLGVAKYLVLNTTAASYSYSLSNGVSPTATAFYTTPGDSATSASGYTYIAYLFATLAGVSKVGSYTGTGTTLNVDCGFTAGARFILIKRTDSTGDWYVWDTARGIIAGNDPYLLLNSTAAEVTGTDYIDPLASGFQITSTAPAAINASGGTYIFLAIA